MFTLLNTKTSLTLFALLSATHILPLVAAEEGNGMLLELSENHDGEPISFVSCPIVQDTSSVPCWYGSFEGQNYYLGITQDIGSSFHPPQLKHKILVEGRILEGQSLCGAPVIHPVKVSVLPEVSVECNTMLPAMAGIEAPPHVRGPGPSNRGLEPRERRMPPPAPTPPYQARTFSVPFTFDSPYMVGAQTGIISQAITYARQIDADRIEVTINRGANLLSDGQHIVETTTVIDQRSARFHTIFMEGGFPEDMIHINAQYTESRGTGIDDDQLRNVEITVHPGN
jgi:hypothetical protein